MNGEFIPVVGSLRYRDDGLTELVALAGLVSRATAYELDDQMLQCLKHPMMSELFSELDGEFGGWISQPEGELMEAAAEDYANLFLLPKGPTSRLSMHLPGERATLGLKLGQTIRRACFELGLVDVEKDPWGKMPEDHVGRVYEILARAATMTQTVASATLARRWIERLRREILQPAIPSWARQMRHHAKTPYYRCVAEMSQACVEYCKAANTKTDS